MRTVAVLLAVLVMFPVFLLAGCGALVLYAATALPPPDCGTGSAGPSVPAVPLDVSKVPDGPVGERRRYSGVQLVNAAHVMNAAAALGLDQRAQRIGVMTAMGESDLYVLDRGDRVGPDSRGLFQQRANGAWGSYADRMDPFTSATNFFRALVKVQGWEGLAPTLAAHRTQINADPYHYEKYYGDAVLVVAALGAAGLGSAPAATAPGTVPVAAAVPVPAVGEDLVDTTCGGPVSPGPGLPAPEVPVSAQGWVKPSDGRVSSGFGMRWHPVDLKYKGHTGTDIAPGCNAPIHAAAAGTVVGAGPQGGYGNLITVDHGGGVVTRYAHMYGDGILVRVGQSVPAGHLIARVGDAGKSTGCHLHFEVKVNGAFTDPRAFLAERGVRLG